MKLIFTSKTMVIVFPQRAGYVSISPRYIYISKKLAGSRKTLRTAQINKYHVTKIYGDACSDSPKLGAEPIRILRGRKIQATSCEHNNQ